MKGAGRGHVHVYVDGVLRAKVDLYRSTAQQRAVVWQQAWTASGTHTVRLVVAGTSGPPRVDVDAFAVLK